MGTAFFDYYEKTGETAKAAFDRLADMSRHMDGASYSGEIGCSYFNGVEPGRYTVAEAAAAAAGIHDRLEKGFTVALAVYEPPVVSTRVIEREFTVPAGAGSTEERVRDLVKLRADERIGHVEVTGEVTHTRKVQVAAEKAKPETRYFIVGAGQRMPEWEAGYPTQAAARAALTENLPKTVVRHSMWGVSTTGQDNLEYEIVSITRRVGGAPLVSASAKVVSSKARLKVTVERLGEQTERTGWYFVGTAPC